MVNLKYYGRSYKIWTKVSCQKGQEKQWRPWSDCFLRSSLIRVFPVCYSDKYFVNLSPEIHHFTWEQKEKSVRNFRKFTITHCSKGQIHYFSKIFTSISFLMSFREKHIKIFEKKGFHIWYCNLIWQWLLIGWVTEYKVSLDWLNENGLLIYWVTVPKNQFEELSECSYK